MSSASRIDNPGGLTIEQLAAESGMSVRNIRAHQARGLLSPPELRMRVGYYGPEHLAQLQLIRELQDDGFNLGGIKRLLEDTDGTAERLLRFKQTLRATATGEQPQTLTIAELGKRFRVSGAEAPGVLAEAVELGVLVPIGDDRYEAPSPSLLALAEEVVRAGISMRSALAILKDLERHCDALSRSFVQLFLGEVWTPFQQADMPGERWPEIEQAVERLRPIASEALMAVFHRSLSGEVEGAFSEITRGLSDREQ